MEKKTLSLSDLQAEANVSAEENNNAVEAPAEDTPVTPQPVEEEKPTSIRDNPLYNLGNPTEDAIKVRLSLLKTRLTEDVSIVILISNTFTLINEQSTVIEDIGAR